MKPIGFLFAGTGARHFLDMIEQHCDLPIVLRHLAGQLSLIASNSRCSGSVGNGESVLQ
jgi:hypothetical protein